MTPEEIAAYKVDKSTWARGPWDDEPDRVDFRHAGLPCLAVRHQDWGHWCGYVAVPKGHPAYGVDPFREDLGISADINYGAACSPPICHVPAPGEPDDVWWLGLDFGHCWDLSPGRDAFLPSSRRDLSSELAELLALTEQTIARSGPMETYRALPYVRRTVEKIAEELAAMEATA